MLVFLSVLLALVAVAAIVYPFVRGGRHSQILEDESSPQAELARRLDSAIAGLKSAELEFAIDALAQDDYRWLRQQHITEAATVMKAMKMEKEQENELLAAIKAELEQVRTRVSGQNSHVQGAICPRCLANAEHGRQECSVCGLPVASGAIETTSPITPSEEVTGE